MGISYDKLPVFVANGDSDPMILPAIRTCWPGCSRMHASPSIPTRRTGSCFSITTGSRQT